MSVPDERVSARHKLRHRHRIFLRSVDQPVHRVQRQTGGDDCASSAVSRVAHTEWRGTTPTERSTAGQPAGAGREGKVMMTRKLVSGVLTVIVLVALSATGAQAGGGGVPSTLTSFFLCKSISGAAVADRFDIESLDTVTPGGAGWGPALDNVKIGV